MPFGRVRSGNSPGVNPGFLDSGRANDDRKAGWLTRRAVLAGGIGTTAIVAMPDLARAAAAERAADAAAPPGHFFLYGTTAPAPGRSAGVQAARSPAPGGLPSSAGSAAASPAVPERAPAQKPAGARRAGASAPVPVATSLAAAPVVSPDQAWVVLAAVAGSDHGPVVTVSILEKASARLAHAAAVTLRGIPADASILVTPVFTPDSSVICLVLGISVPGPGRQVPKRDPRTGATATVLASDWRSQHALAYVERRTGAVAGPFYLRDEPSLALSTAVATAGDLFVWTTPDPRAVPRDKSHAPPPPLPSVSVFPLGEGKARLTVPSPAPWPAGEPVGALASGNVARFVNARTLQVCAAADGDITQVGIAPLAAGRAKPSPATMTPRPDGTLFFAKPAIGRAVIVDPARSFAVRHGLSFAPPAKPFGGLPSKAVLSPDGAVLYVLGGAKSGGLAVYDVVTGKLTGAYGDGRQYSGIYVLPSGTLLAISPDNPRLAYFSADLTPLGTADAGLYVSAVY